MNIMLVKKAGSSALVSSVIDGREVRVVIPADKPLTAETFDAGIPYGLPLEDIVKPAVHTPEELYGLLEAALHNAGLWVAEDFTDARRVLGAVQSVYGLDAGAIIQSVRNYATPKVVAKKVKKDKVTK